MTEGKYAKYVNKLKPKGIVNPDYQKKIRPPMFFDKTVYPASPIDLRFLLIYKSGCGFGCGAQLTGSAGDLQMPKDTPHSHAIDEIFLFIGADPENASDLGGDVEFWIGEGKEAEKYAFNEPTGIFVPKNVVHLPVYFSNVRKPFFMVPMLLGVGEWKANLIDTYPPAFKHKWTDK